MINIDEDILLFQFFVIDCSITMNVIRSNANAPFLIAAETCLIINTFFERTAATISQFQICGACHCFLRGIINNAADSFTQTCTTDADIRTGNHTDAIYPVVWNIFLAEKAWNTIYVLSMTIRSESTNRNILIQAPGLNRDRRIQRKSFVDTVHRRRKSFDRLLTDFRHRKRGIHYILMPQQSNAWFFFDESTRKCTDSIFRLISICIYIHCIQYSISSTTYYPPPKL